MQFSSTMSFPYLRERHPLEGSFYRKPLPQSATELSSEEGKKRLRSALMERNADAFFPLICQFQTQAHPAFCGLTSLCMILNSLQIDPKRIWLRPWRWFMEPMLDCCFDIEKVKTCGVTLDQVAQAARLHGASARLLRGLSVKESRTLIMDSVRGRDDGSFEFIIASYGRQALGQTGTGHFSPIAAYHRASDSVLLLDVARFKYGPHWVSVEELVNATSLLDPDVGMPRGFLAIRKEITGTANETHNTPRHRGACFRAHSILFIFKKQPLILAASILLVMNVLITLVH